MLRRARLCQNPIDKSLSVLVRHVTRAGFPAELKQRGGAGQGCTAALRRCYKQPIGQGATPKPKGREARCGIRSPFPIANAPWRIRSSLAVRSKYWARAAVVGEAPRVSFQLSPLRGRSRRFRRRRTLPPEKCLDNKAHAEPPMTAPRSCSHAPKHCAARRNRTRACRNPRIDHAHDFGRTILWGDDRGKTLSCIPVGSADLNICASLIWGCSGSPRQKSCNV